MDIPILFEDDALLIINKPSGIVVNNARSVKEETIQDWATAYLKISPPDPATVRPPETKLLPNGKSYVVVDKKVEFASRGGIVHRIDKETSGILVIAKSPDIFTLMQERFQTRDVKKTYLALVHGAVSPPAGDIDAPVGRLPWNTERFGIVPGGKESKTHYQIIGEPFTANGETVSQVAVSPLTGRTHQIRIHMKYINHPLLGDYLYAGRVTSRNDRLWAARVMLHAWKISFAHPAHGQSLDFTSPIPDDMKGIIQSSNNPMLK